MEYMLPRPSGVRCETMDLNGLPGKKLVPAKPRTVDSVILFFHGGGYGVGSPGTHLSFTMRLAKATGMTVYSPRYRLAPEAPYPAQLEDASKALDKLESLGFDPGRMVLAGDSAGGNLVLALAQTVKAKGWPMPKALVLVSPWSDATLTQLPPASDALLDPVWAVQMRDAFVTPEHWRNPLVSPVLADFAGFPPTLIQTASAELMVNDAKRLFAAMQAASVAVVLKEAAGLWHDYQLHAGVVPEADRAVAEIADFIAQCS